MTTNQPAVLIVEDEALILLGAVDLIESAGFTAVTASNADEAISILGTRQDIHLVFTDVDMPGSMDGVKLSHYIRDRWPPIHLIVASGKTLADQRRLPDGAIFFSKPYHEQPLIDAIRTFLDARLPS